MFFPELIKNIKNSDRVLEVGPGGCPHPRSDVFLEKYFDNVDEFREQRGNAQEIKLDRPVVYYDGDEFPFKNSEFDYVICSHVIEHVKNIDKFTSEIFRVSSRGYIEVPTIYYEYVFNIPVHINILRYKNKELIYMDKSEVGLDRFIPVQRIFWQSLSKGYGEFVDSLKYIMFEGFEWNGSFALKKSSNIEDFFDENIILHNLIKVGRLSRFKSNMKKTFGCR